MEVRTKNILRLYQKNTTMREIARVTQLSHQRVHQVINQYISLGNIVKRVRVPLLKSGERYCQHCHKVGREGFIIISRYKDKTHYMCNPCNTARHRKWRNTGDNMAKVRQIVKKYEINNRPKQRSWVIAKTHNKQIEPCQVCGTLENIHRHHPDYDKPKSIQFLCSYHHRQAHKIAV